MLHAVLRVTSGRREQCGRIFRSSVALFARWPSAQRSVRWNDGRPAFNPKLMSAYGAWWFSSLTPASCLWSTDGKEHMCLKKREKCSVSACVRFYHFLSEPIISFSFPTLLSSCLGPFSNFLILKLFLNNSKHQINENKTLKPNPSF